MIRSLRRRHGVLILGVAAVVPVLVIAALAVRPTAPIMPAISGPPATDSWTTLDSDRGLHALIESEGSREWLHLVRSPSLVTPDALVYWSPTAPSRDEPFPADAVLLGELGDTGRHVFDLPIRDVPGLLVVYSLAHQSAVTATPFTQIRRLDRKR